MACSSSRVMAGDLISVPGAASAWPAARTTRLAEAGAFARLRGGRRLPAEYRESPLAGDPRTAQLDAALPLPAPRRPKAAGIPEPRLQTRSIVSEYSVGILKESESRDLVEFRQVVSVDGKAIRSQASARHALSLGLQSPDDRIRKRMLEDFARNGLVDIATDYGLILLAFGKRGIADMQFGEEPARQIGSETARSITWEQLTPAGGELQFHGRQSTRIPLAGRLLVRKSDFLPMRVEVWAESVTSGSLVIRDEAVVDYQMSEHGFLTPSSVVHRHMVNRHGPYREPLPLRALQAVQRRRRDPVHRASRRAPATGREVARYHGGDDTRVSDPFVPRRGAGRGTSWPPNRPPSAWRSGIPWRCRSAPPASPRRSANWSKSWWTPAACSTKSTGARATWPAATCCTPPRTRRSSASLLSWAAAGTSSTKTVPSPAPSRCRLATSCTRATSRAPRSRITSPGIPPTRPPFTTPTRWSSARATASIGVPYHVEYKHAPRRHGQGPARCRRALRRRPLRQLPAPPRRRSAHRRLLRERPRLAGRAGPQVRRHLRPLRNLPGRSAGREDILRGRPF